MTTAEYATLYSIRQFALAAAVEWHKPCHPEFGYPHITARPGKKGEVVVTLMSINDDGLVDHTLTMHTRDYPIFMMEMCHAGFASRPSYGEFAIVWEQPR